MTWRHINLWLPPAIYMAIIFHYSSQSEPFPEVTEVIWDKGLHLVEYTVLAAFLCRALQGEGVTWTGAIIGALLATSIYGASDEWHQGFVALRESDLLDWVADTLGASIGAIAYAGVRRRGRRPDY